MIHKIIKLQEENHHVKFPLVPNQQALIMPIGDIHYGLSDFPRKKFVNHLKWGMDHGAWFIGMGDYLDFTPGSQRQIIAPLRDETKQILDSMIEDRTMELAHLMEVTRGRWLGLLEGNHRWDFQTGQSSDQLLAKHLNADFLGTSVLMRIRPWGIDEAHNEADCILYAHHGIGASRTAGGQLSRVEDLLKFMGADICLMGHSHGTPISFLEEQQFSPDGVHYHKKKMLARTGGWLLGYLSHDPFPADAPASKSRGGYVEQKALPPSALGGICIGIGTERIPNSIYYRPTLGGIVSDLE